MSNTSATFYAIDDAEPLCPLPGIDIRGVFGEHGSLSLVRLDPGVELPAHSHPHEQMGMVLEGVLIVMTGGREQELRPRQAYVMPGGVEHAGRGGPDGCLVLDLFVPAREDYRPSAAPPLT